MTDELHIERNSGDITFKEWIDAVFKTEGASLEGNPEVGENPKTGQIVTVGGNPNNVAIELVRYKFFGLLKKKEMVPCIYYQKGKVRIKPLGDINDTSNPIRVVATSIANITEAMIVDKNGDQINWINI